MRRRRRASFLCSASTVVVDAAEGISKFTGEKGMDDDDDVTVVAGYFEDDDDDLAELA
jgi:hypothetical protein